MPLVSKILHGIIISKTRQEKNMQYGKVTSGKFISRPNRFIAYVEIDGKEEICHVKNTGRCRELLVPGAVVYLEVSDNPERKTKYDLIAKLPSQKSVLGLCKSPFDKELVQHPLR